MNVKNLMDNMKERDDYKQQLDQKKILFEQQLNANAKSNAFLSSIESAFEETESSLKSSQRQKQQAANQLQESATTEEITLLRKALGEQTQKIKALNSELVGANEKVSKLSLQLSGKSA